ncbi:MAG: HU family DNA-binding protein [Gammaproteobacteria bacterium]|nr:HU family DNA-binding protein [Gammaproteobacteria bacterium]
MAVKKKATAKKKAAPKKTAVAKVIRDTYNRTALLSHIAESNELSKKQVAGVLDDLKAIIEGHIKKSGPQTFTMPGLFKIKVIRKPATKARKGTNPFTGEEMMFKAKPARNVVKLYALKALKDAAQ